MATGLDPTGGIATAVSQGISGIEGAVELISNLGAEKRAKRELKNLHDPFYQIQNEFIQNKNIAENQAQGGLPSATKDYLTSESQRGLGAAESGILQGGGNINDINKLFDTYNKSIDRTAAEDADMHQKNIDYFIGQNTNLAGEKIKQFTLNQYQPVQEKRKQLSDIISNSKQNQYAGANQVAGSVGAFGTSMENNALLKQLFKTSSNSSTGMGLEHSGETQPFNPATASSTGFIDPFIKTPTFNG